MKQIEVVAAIICKEGTYLAAQRGHGEFEGLWEFPGGKIEPGESSEEALIREIKEELSIDIHIDQWMCTTKLLSSDYALLSLQYNSWKVGAKRA